MEVRSLSTLCKSAASSDLNHYGTKQDSSFSSGFTLYYPAESTFQEIFWSSRHRDPNFTEINKITNINISSYPTLFSTRKYHNISGHQNHLSQNPLFITTMSSTKFRNFLSPSCKSQQRLLILKSIAIKYPTITSYRTPQLISCPQRHIITIPSNFLMQYNDTSSSLITPLLNSVKCRSGLISIISNI